MSRELTAEQRAQLREDFEQWAEQVGALPWGILRKHRKQDGSYPEPHYTYMWEAYQAAHAALLDELEQKDKRIAELEGRTVVLPKPSTVKYVSGEFIHCWPAYTVDSAIRAAGINLTVEG